MAYGTSSDGNFICKFCNITSKNTVNSSGQCSCKPHYESVNGVCVDLCGDGYLLNTSSMACDDGNTDNSDGCSSTCELEQGYKCSNGSESTASTCVYKGLPLKLNVDSIKKS